MTQLRTFILVLAMSVTLGPVASAGDVQVFGTIFDSQDGSDTATGLGARLNVGDTIRLSLGYSYIDEGKIELGDLGELSLESSIIDVGGKFELPLNFYLGVGGSYYILDDSLDASDNEWGVYGNAGWSFGILAVHLFAEVQAPYVVARFGRDGDLDLSGIGLNLGLMFRW